MEEKFDKLWTSLNRAESSSIDESFLLDLEEKAIETMFEDSRKRIPLRALIGIAASFLLLVSVNIYAMNQYSSNQESSSTIESEYTIHPNPLIQYK